MSFVVYTRRHCHLCDQMLEEMRSLVPERLPVELRDVDTREDWREVYGRRVPVLEYDGRFVCQYHLDRDALAVVLKTLET